MGRGAGHKSTLRTAAPARRGGPGRDGSGRPLDPGQDVGEHLLALVVAQQQMPAVEVGGDRAGSRRAASPRTGATPAAARSGRARPGAPASAGAGRAPPSWPSVISSTSPATPSSLRVAQVERVAPQRAQHLDIVRGLAPEIAAADPQGRGDAGQDAQGRPVGRRAGRHRSRPPVRPGSGRPPAAASGDAMAAIATEAPMLSPSTNTGSPGWRRSADSTAASSARTNSGVPGQLPRAGCAPKPGWS